MIANIEYQVKNENIKYVYLIFQNNTTEIRRFKVINKFL